MKKRIKTADHLTIMTEILPKRIKKKMPIHVIFT